MHRGVGLTLLFGCILGGSLAAQEPASSILTGVRPEQLHLDKDYVKNATKAFNASPIIQGPQINKTINPSSYFIPKLPSVSLPSWVPLIGSKKPQPIPVARRDKRQDHRRRTTP